MSTQEFNAEKILENTPEKNRQLVEFYLRMRGNDLLKSWYKASEIADATGLSASQAGHAMRALSVDPDCPLEIDSRSGHRTTAWKVSRPDDGKQMCARCEWKYGRPQGGCQDCTEVAKA